MTTTDHAVCTECGRHTPLRLARRFPHICTDCLFPPADPQESHQDEMPDSVRVPTLMESLYQRARIARLNIPFGNKGVPRGRDDRW